MKCSLYHNEYFNNMKLPIINKYTKKFNLPTPLKEVNPTIFDKNDILAFYDIKFEHSYQINDVQSAEPNNDVIFSRALLFDPTIRESKFPSSAILKLFPDESIHNVTTIKGKHFGTGKYEILCSAFSCNYEYYTNFMKEIFNSSIDPSIDKELRKLYLILKGVNIKEREIVAKYLLNINTDEDTNLVLDHTSMCFVGKCNGFVVDPKYEDYVCHNSPIYKNNLFKKFGEEIISILHLLIEYNDSILTWQGYKYALFTTPDINLAQVFGDCGYEHVSTIQLSDLHKLLKGEYHVLIKNIEYKRYS